MARVKRDVKKLPSWALEDASGMLWTGPAGARRFARLPHCSRTRWHHRRHVTCRVMISPGGAALAQPMNWHEAASLTVWI
ncbi:hypothetical protein VTN96DRAFT_4808 [Rasamsonia emersonii]